MPPVHSARLGSWLTVVIRPRAPLGGAAGGGGPARRLFLTATWLLVGIGIVVPAWEATVFLHDRRVVARDFACLAAARAVAGEPARTAATPGGGRPEQKADAERIALEVDGIGIVTFPAGLSDEETVAAMQAMVVAHHRAGHAPHPLQAAPSPRATAPGGQTASWAEEEARAAATCRITAQAEPRSLSAWRRAYAGEPPSVAAEVAARRAFLRSVLAILAAPLLLALRAWWRWLLGP